MSQNFGHPNILIDAVAEYVKRTGDTTIRLILPGVGPNLESMKELARSKGIEGLVKFPGKLTLDKVYEEYEKSNIALVPSNVETYGRCIAEPFALGRCVVTRRTGVALDIIKDKENGYFFNEANDLHEILMDLHMNPQKIVDAGNNAFKDSQVFHRESVIDSYVKAIYNA